MKEYNITVSSNTVAEIAAAMDALKGEGYFNRSSRVGNDYGFLEVVKRFQEMDKSEYDSSAVCGCIYGNGGIHRYYVLMGGDLCISEMHMYDKKGISEKARKLGITIR